MGKTTILLSALLLLGCAKARRIDSLYTSETRKCGSDKEYMYNDGTDSCYKFHTMRKTWLNAHTECASEGGYLAVINSREEARVLEQLTKTQGYDETYFGYIRIFLGFENWEDGSWRTVLGQPLNESGYVNWRDGEPNNAGGYQRCGAMYSNGEFDDDDCLHKSAFICEKPVSPPNEIGVTEKEFTVTVVPENIATQINLTTEEAEFTSTGTTEADVQSTSVGWEDTTWRPRGTTGRTQPDCGNDTDYKYYAKTDACYKYHNQATWYAANATCVREGGHLAIVYNSAQAKHFNRLIRGYRNTQLQYVRLFVGFKKEGASWITVLGKSLSETGYVNWREGEPNNEGGHQYCGAMYTNGEFDDDDCYHSNPFVCEKKPVSQQEDTRENTITEDYPNLTIKNIQETQTETTTVNEDFSIGTTIKDIHDAQYESATDTENYSIVTTMKDIQDAQYDKTFTTQTEDYSTVAESEDIGYTHITTTENQVIELVPTTDPAVCSLKAEHGRCFNYSKTWFFDMEYGRCYPFLYGGCGGNGNRFPSEQACKDACVKPATDDLLCRLPKVRGPCRKATTRWFYNVETQGCDIFEYSCEGNANNFKSRESCAKRCNGV